MPVTRSEGIGRKPAMEQSASEDAAPTPATSMEVGATTTETIGTGTTAASGTKEYTGTSATTVISAVSLPAATAALSFVSPSAATTLPADATLKLPTKPPTTVADNSRRARPVTEVKRVKTTTGLPLPSGPSELRPPTKKGGVRSSNHSRLKAYKVAKAKEDLLRLQVELAAALLAALENEDTEDEEDDASVYSKEDANQRVDNWLENQQNKPAHTINDQQNCPIEEPLITCVEDIPATTEKRHQTHRLQHLPAGGQSDLAALAEAITSAVNAAQRPKFIELPTFNGSHHEWLPFRAAYYETENMYTSVENTNRLRRNLKGEAKEAVECLLITNTQPAEVMKTLESRFGRPESIAMMEIEALRALPRLTESPRDICIYATKVSNIVATLKTLDCIHYLYNPEVSKAVVDKLTPTLRYRYYDFSSLQPREDQDLVKIDKFLKREADLCGPYALPEQVASSTAATQQKRTQKIHNVTEKTSASKCPVCEETGHNTADCEQFKKLDENGKWDLAKSKRLCFRCLRYRNKTWQPTEAGECRLENQQK